MSHHHHHGSLILEMTAAFLKPAEATNTVRMACALEKAKERLFAPVTDDELGEFGIYCPSPGLQTLTTEGIHRLFQQRWMRILSEHTEEVLRLELLEASAEPELT